MKYIALLLMATFLISCSDSKMLLKSFNEYRVPLDYLHDSKIKECDRSTHIAIGNIDNQVLDSSTTITKLSHKVLPLLFYNYEEVKLAVELGQSSLETNYSDFFKTSFTTESQRTGCFSLIENSTEPEYTVEITYGTCEVNSMYERTSTILFLLLAYSMNFQEIGYPAETELALTVKLKKETDLIFNKKYLITKVQQFINVPSQNVNKLRSDFVVNMAESLSLSTKVCIEQIIADLNQVIEKH